MVTRVICGVSKISERESPRGSVVSTPTASRMSSVSPRRAPRGTASFSGPSGTASLLQLGGVYAVQVEREARGGEVEAKSLHQAVVAAAAAEHVPQGRVVDLEDRAAVVAEVAQQAEVDLHPLGR